MTLILFSFNLLLLVFIWKVMIRKTILDHTRDKLFDLRDELRHEFIDRKWDMNSSLYKELRDMINAHLRYTEHYSVWRFFFLEASLRKNKHLFNHLKQKIEKSYQELDPEKAKFAKEIRMKSQQYMVEFSVYSSGLLLAASFILAPIFTILMLARRGIDAATNSVCESFSHIGRNIKFAWRDSVDWIGQKVLAPEIFESTYERRVWSY